MEDELQILHGLWEEPDGWSFVGRQVSVVDAGFHPKPVQRPRPPIIVGGEGRPRSLRLAARYADEYNMSGADPAECGEKFALLDDECRKIGRDPATMRRSVMAGFLIGADQAELERRVHDLLAMVGTREPTPRPGWRSTGRAGSSGRPIRPGPWPLAFAAAGVERIMLQDMLPRDHGMIELAARELIGKV